MNELRVRELIKTYEKELSFRASRELRLSDYQKEVFKDAYNLGFNDAKFKFKKVD